LHSLGDISGALSLQVEETLVLSGLRLSRKDPVMPAEVWIFVSMIALLVSLPLVAFVVLASDAQISGSRWPWVLLILITGPVGAAVYLALKIARSARDASMKD
ncbi:MAG TPA: hypothetical protein VFX15_12425, partial [Actinomycetes bacterium]|nr:hypothetical protein [Actinomycetes bacterium]